MPHKLLLICPRGKVAQWYMSRIDSDTYEVTHISQEWEGYRARERLPREQRNPIGEEFLARLFKGGVDYEGVLVDSRYQDRINTLAQLGYDGQVIAIGPKREIDYWVPHVLGVEWRGENNNRVPFRKRLNSELDRLFSLHELFYPRFMLEGEHHYITGVYGRHYRLKNLSGEWLDDDSLLALVVSDKPEDSIWRAEVFYYYVEEFPLLEEQLLPPEQRIMEYTGLSKPGGEVIVRNGKPRDVEVNRPQGFAPGPHDRLVDRVLMALEKGNNC